ncbi:MAG: hypothetical protein A2Z34_07705 [Planctomycetes bacterium RBG_16_59_8]|nr:MAG: hypothetical protein A2Z34_07705 [Planctomycetes bacterium RBG_16_59_8]
MAIQARPGNRVRVHYTARLDDGTVVEATEGRQPVEFTIGRKEVILGIEEAVVGMSPGERKNDRIPPAKAYGEEIPTLRFEIGREHLPGRVELAVGQTVEIASDNGARYYAQISSVSEETVLLDANHPLAGKPITCDIALLEILK